MPSDLEQLRRDVSLSETAARYGCRLQRNGQEHVACCPFHTEETPSFTIFRGQDGIERFHCFGCGASGDVLDFVQQIKGVDLAEAVRILDGSGHIRPKVSPRSQQVQDAYEGITPLTPPSEPIKQGARIRLYNPKRKGDRSEWGSFSPSMVFPYRRADGALTGYVLRHDLADGGKETPMVMFARLPDGSETWCRYPFPKPRPLYGLETLGKVQQVIVVEGEKCRDRLAQKTGRTVISWAGGTQGVKHTDWSPLAGRDVVIWPDFDAPGLSTADEIAAILSGLGARVRLTGFADAKAASDLAPFTHADWQAGRLPAKGWDSADAVDAGWTRLELDAFMRATVRRYVPASAAPPPEKPGPEKPGKTEKQGKSGPKIAPPGADGIDRMPEWFPSQPFGSEVWLARIFNEHLEQACGGRIVRADGKFWAYGPSAWRPIPEQKIRLAMHAFDAIGIGPKEKPLKLGRHMLDGIVNELGTRIADPGFFDNPAIGVNALNCTVTLDDRGKVICREHNPDDRFRFTISADYNLHTESHPPEGSLLHRLLYGTFLGDPDAAHKIDLIAEMLGAAAFGLATRIRQPKAFILLGETANNGKSTIASLFRALLPEGSVSSISPAFFNDEKRIINLAGKAANVADELSAAAIAGEEFKAAVTGNPLEGRSLYRNVESFMPRALHCFTTNTLPRFNGGIDRGLRRRLVVIQFNRSIPDKEVIPDIAERIADEELELLLGLAVAGAQRLKRNGHYTIPESSKEALNSWLLLDPLNEWFDIRVQPTDSEPSGGWLRTARLFEDFRKWAIDQGYRESFLPPVNTFSQRLKSMPDVRLVRFANGMIAQGVALKESAASAMSYGDVF
ncbi:5S rRNA maturation endonuclease (ribonuclease M5) [Rhizobium sp. BK650]|uniref:CHC2 zinc finger domain-containing protein n=1 Tax=Rhizobium sp. BK650 TaxID=2586990 RepID=UPI001607BE24|nr:CHC2 zinc finger domain-containing protein [Rhizobium sp. BK650]MBB3656456.1 5S rRNA maturation endonuclease (ribonuclease M5) [Rhizobium sp. BK650]